MAVSIYSCINCGGGVRYDIAEKTFICDHCDSRFSPEQMNEAFPDDENGNLWNTVRERVEKNGDISAETQSFSEVENARVYAYNCPACGAEVLTESETQAAGYCAFCDNPVTAAERLLSGDKLPSRLIPFKKTKEDAGGIFLSKIKYKPLLPKLFSAAAKSGSFKSIYIPFELFSTVCSAGITAGCTNVSRWRDKKYEYVKTDIYEARRAGSVSFSGIPADVSEKINDKDMQALEPFDLSEMTGFSLKYLSGHSAESPTAKRESLLNTIIERIRPVAQSQLLRTVTGYNSVSIESGNTAIEKVLSEYVLMPVWMMTVKHKGVDRIYAVNGQTGKFGGKLPVDWKRAGILFLLSFLSLFALIFIGWEVKLWILG